MRHPFAGLGRMLVAGLMKQLVAVKKTRGLSKSGVQATALLALSACAPTVAESVPDEVAGESAMYAAAPKCPPSKLGTLAEVVPDENFPFVMAVDVQHLRRGPLFGDLEKLMESEAPEAIKAMKACKVPLSSVRHLVLAGNQDGDIVVAAEAPGLGRPATIECLQTQGGVTAKERLVAKTSGCTTTFTAPDGDATGFTSGPDRLIFASTAFAGATKRRVEGKGRSALAGRFSWVGKGLDRSKSAWMAVNPNGPMKAELDKNLPGIMHFGMSVDASKDVGFSVSFDFDTTSHSAAAETLLRGFADQAGMFLPMLGLSPSVADTIRLSRRDRTVTTGLTLTAKDLEALRNTISPPPVEEEHVVTDRPPRKGI